MLWLQWKEPEDGVALLRDRNQSSPLPAPDWWAPSGVGVAWQLPPSLWSRAARRSPPEAWTCGLHAGQSISITHSAPQVSSECKNSAYLILLTSLLYHFVPANLYHSKVKLLNLQCCTFTLLCFVGPQNTACCCNLQPILRLILLSRCRYITNISLKRYSS